MSLVVGKGTATNELTVSMVDVSLEDVKEGCWIVAIDMMLIVRGITPNEELIVDDLITLVIGLVIN